MDIWYVCMILVPILEGVMVDEKLMTLLQNHVWLLALLLNL
jgi:hypothetical protein